jgi:hypothetical protein
VHPASALSMTPHHHAGSLDAPRAGALAGVTVNVGPLAPVGDDGGHILEPRERAADSRGSSDWSRRSTRRGRGSDCFPPVRRDGDFFGRPASTTKTIGLHPLTAPIRAVRETVSCALLPRRLVLRRLVQQQQNCHNHMVSVSRGHPAAGVTTNDRGGAMTDISLQETATTAKRSRGRPFV